MDVSLVTQRISLHPDISGEVLLDVVNTADVIDALTVELAGIPGAVVHLENVPTLFPGERRRLPLRVQLPAQVPAGRHDLQVRIEATAGQQLRQATVIVDVWPKPELGVGFILRAPGGPQLRVRTDRRQPGQHRAAGAPA